MAGCRDSSVECKDPLGDVLQDPVHALQEVVPSHCAASHNLPVVCLDLLQLQHVTDLLWTQGARQILQAVQRLKFLQYYHTLNLMLI